MSSTQFWVGALVPHLVNWANPYLKKFFKLNEFYSHPSKSTQVLTHPTPGVELLKVSLTKNYLIVKLTKEPG